MKLEDIHSHWTDWSKTYGDSLRATTKTSTAKVLEINAIWGRLKNENGLKTVLEVGCGNGVNCVELAMRLPEHHFDGVDFVDEMVSSARSRAVENKVSDRIRFFEGNVVKLDEIIGLKKQYDIIFSDRCLINLNTTTLQIEAISALADLLRPGGLLLMIENSKQTYDQQNALRSVMNLPERTPAEFNLFFDEEQIRPAISNSNLILEDVEDFISLHDILLYVLVPAINGGEIDYDHPLVHAATKLCEASSTANLNEFGKFGQNRLFVCRKKN